VHDDCAAYARGCAPVTQLPLDFNALSPADLRAMLAAGLIEPSGATEDSRVVAYRLTSVGRILLGNQLGKEARANK
jgi:hypothetical protein